MNYQMLGQPWATGYQTASGAFYPSTYGPAFMPVTPKVDNTGLIVSGVSSGVSVLGGIVNTYLALKTAEKQAKSQTEIAGIQAQIASLAVQANMSVAELDAQAKEASRKQMLWLGVAGIGVAGLLAAAAIFS